MTDVRRLKTVPSSSEPPALADNVGQGLNSGTAGTAAQPVIRRELLTATPIRRDLTGAEAAKRVTTVEAAVQGVQGESELAAEIARRRAAAERVRAFQDTFVGYPADTDQLADLFDEVSRLCGAGWTAPAALTQAAAGARPELRTVFERAAALSAQGVTISDAVAAACTGLCAAVVPALRAWERNGHQDGDLRTIVREMRRLAGLQHRNTFVQIRSLMAMTDRREQSRMAAASTRGAERRIRSSRAGIAQRSRATMRWTDLFVSMWRCGVPISEALDAAGEGCGNNYYRHVLAGAAQLTREGIPLSDCLAETRLLPIGLIDRLKTGEATGRMDESLEEFARVMECDAKELGGQTLFMQRILPLLIAQAAIVTAVIAGYFGGLVAGLMAAALFVAMSAVAWPLIFKQTVAGEANLGIGERERTGAAEKEQP